jgi:hypothetical protein
MLRSLGWFSFTSERMKDHDALTLGFDGKSNVSAFSIQLAGDLDKARLDLLPLDRCLAFAEFHVPIQSSGSARTSGDKTKNLLRGKALTLRQAHDTLPRGLYLRAWHRLRLEDCWQGQAVSLLIFNDLRFHAI